MDQFDVDSLMTWLIKNAGMTKVLSALYHAIPEPKEDEEYLKQLISDLREVVRNYARRHAEHIKENT